MIMVLKKQENKKSRASEPGAVNTDELGFKAGLEIHQQLSGKKLFSAKPAEILEGDYDRSALRRMNLTASELGTQDRAALDEINKKREFNYGIYSSTVSLVEIDEEPPIQMSKGALRTALQFSHLTSASLIDNGIIMRKIVVDGSNTSGFQRTMLLAVNGLLEYEHGKIPIETITVEEDSAKIEGRNRNTTHYNLSRLGIPLIEIATAPKFSSPEQLKAGAFAIGSTLRLLSGVKRGLGTIRQDVNISIRQGSRVEIKGAQDLRTLDKLAHNEAKRQKRLLEFISRIKEESLQLETSEIKDITKIFEKTESKMLKAQLKSGNKILGMRLKGWLGLTGFELYENKRIGSEMSDYIKMHTTLRGLFHGDEMPNYGITEDELKSIRKELKCENNDNFIMVAAKEDEARKALQLAFERAKILSLKVPSEVRRANADTSTSYLREMPGAARMYPETDLRPVKLREIHYEKPKTRAKIEDHYRNLNLNDEFVKIISGSAQRAEYDGIIEGREHLAPLAAKAMFYYTKEAKARHDVDINTESEDFMMLLNALLRGEVLEDSFVDALAELSTRSALEIIEKYAPQDKSEIENDIKSIVKSLLKKNPGITKGAIIGDVMKKYRGKISGKDINGIVDSEM